MGIEDTVLWSKESSTPSEPSQKAAHTSPEDRDAQGYHLPYRLGPMPDEGNHFGPTFLSRMNRSLQTSLTATPILTLRQPNEALNKRHLACL